MTRRSAPAPSQAVLFDQHQLAAVGYEYEPHLTPAEAEAYWTLAGRCSGLPDCCVAWYVEEQRRQQWTADPAAEAEVRAYHATIPKGTGYVPCPSCLSAQAFVRVRNCWEAFGGCLCVEAKDMALAFPPTARRAALDLMAREILG